MRVACIAVAGTALLAATLAGADDTSRLRAIGEGRALYLTHCASCHGQEGTALAGHDLTAIVAREGTFSRLTVANHIGGNRDGVNRRTMPAWHTVFVHSWPGGNGPAMLATRKLVRYLEFVQAAPPTTVAEAEPR
jgi:mono/diheme cytochrome c family protein